MRTYYCVILIFILSSLTIQAQRVSGPTLPDLGSARSIDFAGELIFAEGFDHAVSGTLPTGWSTFSLSGNGFTVGTGGTAPFQTNENGFWPVPLKGFFAFTNDDVCNCDKSNDRLQTRIMDLSGYENVQLGFNAFQNGSAGQTAQVQLRSSQQTWTTIMEIPASSRWESYRMFIPEAFLTSGFRLRFVYSDNNSYASGLAIDDVFMGINTDRNVSLDRLYMIDGNDAAAQDFYSQIPLKQARIAGLQPGAKVDNEGINQSAVNLETSFSGNGSYADSIGSWLVAPFSSSVISYDASRAFHPTDIGTYNFTGIITTDSTDDNSNDNASSTSFEVTDSVYKRHHGETDGTGIWVLESIDRLGLAFHLFQSDTVKHIRIQYHTACEAGSRYRIKVFDYDTLTSSIFSSSPIVIEESQIGTEVTLPLNLFLEANKYLFVIEKELGTVVIASNQQNQAVDGNVLSQRAGQSWRDFPYIPFISLIMPIDQPCDDYVFADIEHVSCAGTSDGSIEVSLGTGIADTYDWSFVNGNNPLADNLAGGSYSVTITDVLGCAYTRSFRLNEPEPLKFNAALTDDTCSNGIGSVGVSTSGGTSPIDLLWNDGSKEPAITGLSAGNYTLSITDINGCDFDSTLSVVGSPDFDIAVFLERPGCGDSNGLIAPDILGGAGDFTYEWSNGSTNDSLTQVPVGLYSVTITDTMGCENHVDIPLNDSTSATLTMVTQEDISCQGSATGRLRVQATGNPPFIYEWNTGSFSDSLSQLDAGIYSVTVTDLNLCQSVLQGSINSLNSSVNVDLDGEGNICANDTSGTLDAFASGGTSPYAYNWNTGQTSQSISGLIANTYSVTITDANGCTSTDSALLGTSPILFITIDSVNYLTDSLIIPDGAVFTSAAGGVLPYSYLWSTGSTSSGIIGLDSGVYTLTVTDQLGCTVGISQYIWKFPLGVNTLNASNELSIFPNPAFSGSTISVRSSLAIKDIRLIHNTGQVSELESLTPSQQYRLNDVATGIYYLQVDYLNGGKDYKRLLIIR